MNGTAYRHLVRYGILNLAVLLCGCATSLPLRHAEPELASSDAVSACKTAYRESDGQIKEIATNFELSDDQRTQRLKGIARGIEQSQAHVPQCWTSSHEIHDTFELFYAEFDDSGLATDRATDISYEQSELHLIEKALLADTQDPNSSGLDIVVFAHGWHGSARATDDYSIEFKGVLQDIVGRQQLYLRSPAGTNRAVVQSATLPSSAPPQPHKVIGIEIAWRGDSILFPKVASVWDRKLAAETVSTGSVHELLAFLNSVYINNSCHGREARETSKPCDRVHLLTIGHSYGALITFRSLVPRLQSGLNVDPCFRAYGFGDMTILLNPAFEGARYRGLFNQALSRHVLMHGYLGDPDLVTAGCTTDAPREGEVQEPTIVTLQSQGDWATGTFFPIFRRLTTPFAKTLSHQETVDKNRSIGWVDEYHTHVLEPAETTATDDECKDAQGTFCPFVGMVPGGSASGTTAAEHRPHVKLTAIQKDKMPKYMPLWSVEVAKPIMRNHDDFWNPQTVALISQLFEDVYKQSERLHARREN